MARQKRLTAIIPSFTLDEALKADLDAFQERSRIPRAVIIREALTMYLEVQNAAK